MQWDNDNWPFFVYSWDTHKYVRQSLYVPETHRHSWKMQEGVIMRGNELSVLCMFMKHKHAVIRQELVHFFVCSWKRADICCYTGKWWIWHSLYIHETHIHCYTVRWWTKKTTTKKLSWTKHSSVVPECTCKHAVKQWWTECFLMFLEYTHTLWWDDILYYAPKHTQKHAVQQWHDDKFGHTCYVPKSTVKTSYKPWYS